MFLKILQNLQENACVSASLLINFSKSYFPVNFAKFSRTPFLQSTSGRLFLNRLMSCFPHTAQKMKFSIKDFFSKYAQIGRKMRIWSHLLKKSLMGTSFFVQFSMSSSAFTTRWNPKHSSDTRLFCKSADKKAVEVQKY